MKRAASTFFLAMTVSVTSIFAQNNSANAALKPSTTDCPSWDKKQPATSKANYFAYLRKSPSRQNGPSNPYIENKNNVTASAMRTNNERVLPQNNFRTERTQTQQNTSATRLTQPAAKPSHAQTEDLATIATPKNNPAPVKNKKTEEQEMVPAKALEKKTVAEEKTPEAIASPAKSETVAKTEKSDTKTLAANTLAKKKPAAKTDKSVRIKKNKI